MVNQSLINYIADKVIATIDASTVKTKKRLPVAISGRHVHLSQRDWEQLFGVGCKPRKAFDLSQIGQFACLEKVDILVNDNRIKKVRVLGPFRQETQVEISMSDGRRLGIKPMIRNSGELNGTSHVVIEGPKGRVELNYGLIVAKRHIHMNEDDAIGFGVKHNQEVSVYFYGQKGGMMHNVTCKVDKNYVLEMHIDVDEASAFGVSNGDVVEIR